MPHPCVTHREERKTTTELPATVCQYMSASNIVGVCLFGRHVEPLIKAAVSVCTLMDVCSRISAACRCGKGKQGRSSKSDYVLLATEQSLCLFTNVSFLIVTDSFAVVCWNVLILGALVFFLETDSTHSRSRDDSEEPDKY